MSWNWEKPDWPNFTWNHRLLDQAEERFLMGRGTLAGAFRHLGLVDREHLTVEVMSAEALTTSEIEGEILDRASVQSSIRRHLGLQTDRRRAKPAEQGVAEMMVDLYRSFALPLADAKLFAWHQMIMNGRRDLLDIGRYRTSPESIQVVSGSLYAPRIHFEAPPSRRVTKEMARFVKWFNRTAPDGKEPLPAMTRAGIAHLYFESVHPFEDGNGRIGRAIAEKALAQAAGQPTLTALAATILIRRKSYYAALEAANQQNDVTDWLRWFAGIALEAQERTVARVDFVIDKTRLLDRLRGQLNERQEKVLLRMLREGPEGFEGGLSAGNYSTITGGSPATITRDLGELVELGALLRTGERRHARYALAIPQRPVEAVQIGRNGKIS